ncbi:hypothetical protein CR513_10353, partial [Mucuna pruriens]
MDPLKYIFEKPALIGRIARWQMALSEYDIIYTKQKAVKGRALAEQLAHHPLDEYHPSRCRTRSGFGRVETLVRWSFEPTREQHRCGTGIPGRPVLPFLNKARL